VLKRNDKGFTLIELLIVIVIIGILAAVAIPNFQGVSDKARVAAAQSELATIKNALGMYQAENDSAAYPSNSTISSHATLVSALAPYISLPSAGEASWTWVSYNSASKDTFVLTAKAKDRKSTQLLVTPNEISVVTP